MSPMAVLVFRFGLAAAILSGWALAREGDLAHRPHAGARPDQRTARPRALLFTCLYVALLHGAPAVLGAVIISMNPVVTALLAAMFLGEGLTLDAGRRAGARRACRAGRLRGPADDGRRSRRRRSCCCWCRWSASPRAASTSRSSAPAWTSARRRRCRTRRAWLPVVVLAARDAVDGDGPVEGGGRGGRGRAVQRHPVHDDVRPRRSTTTARRRSPCCSRSFPPSRACCPG